VHGAGLAHEAGATMTWEGFRTRHGAARAGADLQAGRIEELFRRHAADVLAYALRRTDAATADDIVGEVFAIAWRRADRIPRDEPVLWLYAVARRALSNRRRSVRRQLAFEASLQPITGTEAQVASTGRLAAAMDTLSPSDREILLLTAWEDLDAPQIAAVLGCSVGAAYTRLHRAKRRLATALAHEAEQHPTEVVR
jgi:RNA polymerase sigma-70 factor (ECF subfamily)